MPQFASHLSEASTRTGKITPPRIRRDFRPTTPGRDALPRLRTCYPWLAETVDAFGYAIEIEALLLEELLHRRVLQETFEQLTEPLITRPIGTDAGGRNVLRTEDRGIEQLFSGEPRSLISHTIRDHIEPVYPGHIRNHRGFKDTGLRFRERNHPVRVIGIFELRLHSRAFFDR